MIYKNDDIELYIDALRPILYIKHFDYYTVERKIISSILENEKRHCVEYSKSHGLSIIEKVHSTGLLVRTSLNEDCSLEDFLRQVADDGYNEDGRETVILLKDVQDDLREIRVQALIREIAEKHMTVNDYYAFFVIVAPELVLPKSLENYITVYDFPLPRYEEIKAIIHDGYGEVKEDVLEELALSLKGLNEFQIKQVLNLTYANDGELSKKDKKFIQSEKMQLVKKSGLLEVINSEDTLADLGGLDELKAWLNDKAHIFQNLADAKRHGVNPPRGILITGKPGCGKSLAAKVTANILDTVLLRLDMGRLLGKYVGESEENMREALKLVEAISPCVLWIDEIEKAMSGIGDGSNEVTTRLFGHFLTWLQEKENTVFVVATANNIEKLPEEFKRKGRFDEIFEVEFPNREEFSQILEIQFAKRGYSEEKLDNFRLGAIVNKYSGHDLSGADIEAVVNRTFEKAYIAGKKPDFELLEETFKRVLDRKKDKGYRKASRNS